MRLGSEMEGLARAMQDQEEAWPKRARAILESESPLCTLSVVEAREEAEAGRKIREPVSM